MNEEVGDFLDILGPFYEFLPEKENDSKKVNAKCLGEMNNNKPGDNNNLMNYRDETAADIVSSML